MFGSLSRGGTSLVSCDLCPVEMTKAVQRMLKRPRLQAQRMLAADASVAHCCRLTIPPQGTKWDVRIFRLSRALSLNLCKKVSGFPLSERCLGETPKIRRTHKENPNGDPSKSKEKLSGVWVLQTSKVRSNKNEWNKEKRS